MAEREWKKCMIVGMTVQLGALARAFGGGWVADWRQGLIVGMRDVSGREHKRGFESMAERVGR